MKLTACINIRILHEKNRTFNRATDYCTATGSKMRIHIEKHGLIQNATPVNTHTHTMPHKLTITVMFRRTSAANNIHTNNNTNPFNAKNKRNICSICVHWAMLINVPYTQIRQEATNSYKDLSKATVLHDRHAEGHL